MLNSFFPEFNPIYCYDYHHSQQDLEICSKFKYINYTLYIYIMVKRDILNMHLTEMQCRYGSIIMPITFSFLHERKKDIFNLIKFYFIFLK